MKQPCSISFISRKSLWLVLVCMCFQSALKAQGDVDIWFYDPCKNEVVRLTYWINQVTRLPIYPDSNGVYQDEALVVERMKDRKAKKDFKIRDVTPGTYIVHTGVSRGPNQWWVENSFPIDVGPDGYSDTLKLNRISKVFNAINSSTVYMNCDQLCNGVEEEFYEDGTIMLRGQFENGVGREINFYNEEGLIEGQISYKPGDAAYVSTVTYHQGKMIEYRIHERINKKKVKEYVYNPDSTLAWSMEFKWPKKGY